MTRNFISLSYHYTAILQTVDGVDVVAHGLAHGAARLHLPRHPDHRLLPPLGPRVRAPGAVRPHHYRVIQLSSPHLPSLLPSYTRSDMDITHEKRVR